MIDLKSRFEGCLLGMAIGDSLGGLFEGQDPEYIAERFPTPADLLGHDWGELRYTDDTQMAIGVAETLVAHGEIVESELCRAFVANYEPRRGYGRGARAILEAMEAGADHGEVATRYFPGGSFGNGAAMRVAPIGLLFHSDLPKLQDQARLSALPTHRHPLGIEGAKLLAVAVGLVCELQPEHLTNFFKSLFWTCTTDVYRDKIKRVMQARQRSDLPPLGNGIQALESVPTAIAAFAISRGSFEETITNAIYLGGDTDTIAAMAGAISGAYLGVERIPARMIGLLEQGPKGGPYIRQLAGKLFERAGWTAISDQLA